MIQYFLNSSACSRSMNFAAVSTSGLFLRKVCSPSGLKSLMNPAGAVTGTTVAGEMTRLRSLWKAAETTSRTSPGTGSLSESCSVKTSGAVRCIVPRTETTWPLASVRSRFTLFWMRGGSGGMETIRAVTVSVVAWPAVRVVGETTGAFTAGAAAADIASAFQKPPTTIPASQRGGVMDCLRVPSDRSRTPAALRGRWPAVTRTPALAPPPAPAPSTSDRRARTTRLRHRRQS